ncbi:glutamate-cysteine ligase family protein [Corynebacterium uropygiale]|uniref:Glutamate-cysteine ligase family protein n=1 Tax=Corynebacterium uropygiale TaxID=1775911 RepID=A0A9X1QQ44_9CORY|nr:glutamate-cysteine ligase family protein [Corynebacterium uropygiale]MCF4006736.1 glutamate-cysteine ligase family protein [Corynebacterium uropygiale]
MGDAVSTERYSPLQRTRYRERLAEDLETFDRHLQRAEFDDAGSIGLELELNLIDSAGQPAAVGPRVLESLSGDDEFQSEIGAFNVELNHPVVDMRGDGLERMERGVAARIERVREAAAQHGARPVMIGTLPTLTSDFLESEEWMTPENRYRALNNAIMESRGELVRIDLADREHLHREFHDIAPEASCTSMQLHLQVSPYDFAAAWNASQAAAASQVALSANSPLFLGHQLWHESRIPVFTQSIDTRTAELQNQGVRPRVWFGERWITSVFDLFEENVRYFSPLLPESREASGTPVVQGGTPALHYLNLHNGTVWRWNRPIYAPAPRSSEGPAHLRVENRLLPAAPSVLDAIADAAYYYGLVHDLIRDTRPVWSRLGFAEAEHNFTSAARAGIHARLAWPTLGRVDAADLILDYLLPRARRGLEYLEVDRPLIDRYLGVIAERARLRSNGATWQLRTLRSLVPLNSLPQSPERSAALAELVERYVALQATGEPVHTWRVES